jgi:replicative DNA helicase
MTPQSAEHAIIGMIINDATALESVLAAGIRESHFYDPECITIFREIMRSDAANEPFDLPALGYKLGQEFTMRLVAMTENAPRTQSIEFFAEEVEKIHFGKQAEKAALDIADFAKSFDRKKSRTELKSILSGKVDFVIDDSKAQKNDAASVADRFVAMIDEAYENKRNGKPFGYSTGIGYVDKIIHGFRPEALYLIGARPGVGKSELCCNFALNVATAGHGAAYFTFEMTGEEIAARMISRMSGVNDTRMLQAEASDSDLDAISQATNRFATLPIFIEDGIRPSWSEVKLKIRQLVRKYGIKVVFIDYIQQLQLEGFKPFERVRELSQISMEAKALARELKISIVCAAQLNRNASDKDDTPPEKRHLKESGSLEQDANVVMLLHRKSCGAYDLIVDKNRHGQEGIIPLKINFETHNVQEGR